MALTKAQLIDLNGDELILDLDADTSITADTDDQIDIKIAGADDFRFTANTFTALAGSGVVIPDGGLTLGSTAVSSTAAELNLLDGVSGLVQADLTKLAAIDATAAEINLIDGGTSRGTTAVADADGILTNDGGTMRLTTAATFKTYFQDGVTASSIAADDIATGDAAVNLTTSSGNITIDAAANDSDIIFKGTDATADITMLTLDGSEAGAATFNDKVIATELDISGAMDIDGTSNLDAVDIDGAVQIDAAFTSGVDGQGYDTKFFGDTSSAYMLWDTSADDLVFAGAAGIDLAGDIDVDGTANLDVVDIDGAVDMASTLAVAGVSSFAVAANVAQVALTSSSNAVAWDASAAANAYHLTTENTTISAPSNAVEGAFICLELNHDGTTTVAWNAIFNFAADTAPTTTDTNAKTDILVFRYNGAIWQEVGRTLNIPES